MNWIWVGGAERVGSAAARLRLKGTDRLILVRLCQGGGSHRPAQRRCVDRRIPERDEGIVEGRYRHRAAGHLERGHVAAGETARHRQPGSTEDPTYGVRHEVELERWRASKAVDEEQHGCAAFQPQVPETRLPELASSDLHGLGT